MGPKTLLVAAPIWRLRGLACLLLAGVLALPDAAHAAESGTSTASTILVKPLSIVKSEDMDFGTIIPETGGTVVLNPTINPTCTTTGALIRSGECQPAEFVGAGSVLQLVRVRIPPNARMTVSNGAGATMRVDDMTVNGNPDLLVVRLNQRTFRFLILHPSGIFYFRVGGTLNVGANQAVGTYTGTFDVDIQYF